MEKIHGTRMFCAFIACKHACFHVFSPFSAHLYPPLHHNGKWIILAVLVTYINVMYKVYASPHLGKKDSTYQGSLPPTITRCPLSSRFHTSGSLQVLRGGSESTSP